MLQLFLVDQHLFLMLPAEILKRLREFELVVLLHPAVHLHHALILTSARLAHLLRDTFAPTIRTDLKLCSYWSTSIHNSTDLLKHVLPELQLF